MLWIRPLKASLVPLPFLYVRAAFFCEWADVKILPKQHLSGGDNDSTNSELITLIPPSAFPSKR